MTPVPSGKKPLCEFETITPLPVALADLDPHVDTASSPIGEASNKLQPITVALFFFFHVPVWQRARVWFGGGGGDFVQVSCAPTDFIWNRSQAFILGGGLRVLVQLFVHSNLHMRSQALESFVTVGA